MQTRTTRFNALHAALFGDCIDLANTQGSPSVHSQPPWPNGKPWTTDTANPSRPKSRTTSARGFCRNRTQVPDTSPALPPWQEQCDLCLARPLSPATEAKEQPRWHTVAEKHHCHCASRPSPTIFSADRAKTRDHAKGSFGSSLVLSIKNDVFANVSKDWCASLSAKAIFGRSFEANL